MKTPKTLRTVLLLGCVLVSYLCPVAGAGAPFQGQKMRIDGRTIRPNQLAPELYADELSLKITLMNLPGAATPASYWEVEYKVYFVAEQDFETTVKELNKAGKGRDLRPGHFQSKILLAEGKFNKQKLTTLKDRAFLRHEIEFRDRVPHAQQTSFSRNFCKCWVWKISGGDSLSLLL